MRGREGQGKNDFWGPMMCSEMSDNVICKA